MESFSTAGLPARRKLSFWNEISSETFAPMEIIPSDREHFQGRLCRESVGPLVFANVYTSPGVVRQTCAHLAFAEDRGYTLLTPIVGGVTVDLPSQTPFAVRVGEFCLVDHSRPFCLTHERPSQSFCVGLSARLLRGLIPQPELASGVLMQPTRSTSRLLSNLLRDLSAELEADAGGTTAQFAHCLAGFIAAAYAHTLDISETSLRERRRHSIAQYVDQQLHDPLLRPAGIAHHFRISSRYLRLIFESGPEPLFALILRRRLQRCALMLRDPGWRQLTITDIAFRNGFNNATHFGQAFKSRFGITPREYRRGDEPLTQAPASDCCA